MTIKISVDAAFVDVLVTNNLMVEDLPELLRALETAPRNGPFVVLTDTLKMREAPASVLMAFSNQLKALPPMKDVWLADAVVTGSALARFALSTLIMVAPLPTNVKVFEARRTAERWCATVLETAGVAVPESLRMHLPHSLG